MASQHTPKSPARRQMLVGSASALAAASLGGLSTSAQAQEAAAKALPAYAAWKDGSAMIVHSSSTLELKRGAFGNGLLTPANKLFVRNNLPAPDAKILDNRDAWQISIEGVKGAKTLTLGELKQIGLDTLVMVLQCSGNGRGFFPSKPSGTPWQVGAAGCVAWTGVPVRDVVAALGGVDKDMLYMTGTGGEVLPAGVDPKSVIVERSVPLAAMKDALLAWEMNDEPIPLAHGGPLRLIVPGYTGVNNIKYIKRLAFTAKESDAKIMAHGYRMTKPGEKSDPNQPSVLAMGVKSWITSPLPEDGALKPGKVQIQGVAFGGAEALKHVEVSLDLGATWQKARLVGPDLGKYAWRHFVLTVDLPAGTHVLVSRATNAKDVAQPAQREDNAHGYSNNSWVDHSVRVAVA